MSHISTPHRTVIENVRVLDTNAFGPPTTVSVEGGMITSLAAEIRPEDEVVDGRGRFLVPGFIEGHAHVKTPADLAALARWGVTTMLDMGHKDPDVVRGLREGPGAIPDVLLAGLPASAPKGVHVRKEGFPRRSAVVGPSDAARFVGEQVGEGVDFIKVIVEDPKMPGTESLSDETVAAIVAAAHDADRCVVAHAVTATAASIAGRCGVDVLTHAPLDKPLDADTVAALTARGTALMPTLVMMRDVAAALMARLPLRILSAVRIAPRLDVAHASDTVRAWHEAGGTILVGTDANATEFAPAHPSYGVSFHEELELLVQAGLTPVEVLQAATAGNAAAFGLTDRGAVATGRRADLVLLSRDPSTDIRATRDIAACWIGGVRADVALEYAPDA